MTRPDAPSADGRHFAEPWQARAFALVVKLAEQGHFTWPEWTETLAAEIAVHGKGDDGSDYYRHWLAALETLVAKKRLATPAAMAARKEEWEDAYRTTPHGRPVMLGAARADNAT